MIQKDDFFCLLSKSVAVYAPEYYRFSFLEA